MQLPICELTSALLSMATFPGHHTRECITHPVEDALYSFLLVTNHIPFIYLHSPFPSFPEKTMSFSVTKHLQPNFLILPCALPVSTGLKLDLIFL